MTRVRKLTMSATASSIADAAWAGIDPEGCFRRHASDTEPFLLKFPGLGDVLFVSTVDGARDILTAPGTLCRAPLPNPIEPVVGQNSLILLSGDAHRRTRSILMPAFRGERMRSYVDLIADATNDEITALQPGDQLVVRDAAQAITLDVVIRVVFGVTDRARRAEYARVINELMRSGTAPLMLVPWLRREIAGRGPWARLVGFRAQLDALLSEQIEERRGLGEHGSDVMELILTATDEDGNTLGDDALRRRGARNQLDVVGLGAVSHTPRRKHPLTGYRGANGCKHAGGDCGSAIPRCGDTRDTAHASDGADCIAQADRATHGRRRSACGR
jgi:cytochrome P450